MRIQFITQWFEPEPTFKGLAFARALKEAGHDVEVITGFPNYPAGVLYPGYRIRFLQRETIDGVLVNRVPLYPSHSSSGLARAFNYVSFAVSSCLFGIFGAGDADVIYVYHPPLTTSISAAIVGFFRRTPFVIDVNDLWPDTLRATGMIRSERLLGIAGRVCSWTYRRAARIVVGTPGFRRKLIERGVPEVKIDLIYNWSDEVALRAAPPAEMKPVDGLAGRFNVVFAGTMGKAQGNDAVVRAAKLVEAAAPSVQFVLVGGGIEVDNLKALARSLDCRNLLFLPRMPMNQIGAVLERADVLLVHLRADPLFEITLPSKTQAYMGAGKPVLMAVKGDAADLISAAGAGRCALPGDEASLAATVIELARTPAAELAAMGRRGADYYSEHLSLRIGAGKFVDVFRRAAK